MMEVEDVRTLQAICRTHADRDLATARALLPSRGWQSPAGEASRPRLLSAESRMMDSAAVIGALGALAQEHRLAAFRLRSEEHTSELQSLMRISSAVFCLKKK